MRFPLELEPGIFSDGTPHSEQGRWIGGSNVRFNDEGRPEVIRGWERLMLTTALTGVCRAIFPWSDTPGVINVGFGTHSKLQLWQGGALFDVTPFGPPAALAANPLTVTNGSAVVTVAHVAHGLTTGTSVIVSGAAAVGGITPNGTFAITVTDADHYTYVFTGPAAAGATGGGSAVRVTPQTVIPAGAIDGAGQQGFGTGGYGVGGYNQPSTGDYFPRTWSLAAWGQQLLASYRGGTIYAWTNNTAARAVAVANAPLNITQMLVAPMSGGYQAFALGCNEEVSGAFNPLCIRHSSVRNNAEWSTTATGSTAREYILTGGGRIVGGKMTGPYLLVWTTVGLYLGRFIGDLGQPWKFDQVGKNCGLIGPNAVAVVGQRAYWIAPDRQVWTYSPGGEPTTVTCPVRKDFAENLAASQSDKIVGSTIAEQGEIRFDYPDKRDGYENSRYIALRVAGPMAGLWYAGVMARTAMVDAGPTLYPLGVTTDGVVFYHEKGQSADGAALTYYLESGDLPLDDDVSVKANCLWPDIKDQAGSLALTIYTRFVVQGPVTVFGPYPIVAGAEKVDFNAKARYVRLRIEGSGNPAAFTLGVPVVNVTPSGRR